MHRQNLLSAKRFFQESLKLALHSVTLQMWDTKQGKLHAYIVLSVGYMNGRKNLILYENKEQSLNLPIDISVTVLIYAHLLLSQQRKDILQQAVPDHYLAFCQVVCSYQVIS